MGANAEQQFRHTYLRYFYLRDADRPRSITLETYKLKKKKERERNEKLLGGLRV